jgi:tetratricopeptide (TPR) repeat protein
MRHYLAGMMVLPLLLSACSLTGERGTLAELRSVKLELADTRIEDGLEKAMQSYSHFLQQTPETAMTPEAIRRLADLSIEKEYGYIQEADSEPAAPPAAARERPELSRPETAGPSVADTAAALPPSAVTGAIAAAGKESERDFESRATQTDAPPPAADNDLAAALPEGGDDLHNANAAQAIKLYRKLLEKYPLYERNDQVLYQMSRAYEELGQVEAAMEVMNRFVSTYPDSRYMDEIQFRRAEYFFTRKKFLDAEDAYSSIVNIGSASSYYELALYKLGWAYYKQELYEEALNRYIALLDYKVRIGYDFDQHYDQTESKRVEDTYRVISLSFSNLGGAEAVVDYFNRYGGREYEDKVYSNLGEFYLSKRRYSDAAESYQAFVGLYPFHEIAPHFNMRVIDIYKQGGFSRLVVEAKKAFAKTYALNADYWRHFAIDSRPDVVGFLKTNLKDLANHYHALYQDKRFAKEKGANYLEALSWYRAYLASFPKEDESPAINYQMAELMLENKDFGEAATAYENTAYGYPQHEKASAAGYAAVFAHREHLKVVVQAGREEVRQQIIRSSLRFADTYPAHEKVPVVLGAAADDLYGMKNYALAVKTAQKLVESYPGAERELIRSAWLVIGHGSFDLSLFADAEKAYSQVLLLTAEEDKGRADLLDNLAASIYKQGEQANTLQDYKTAAGHFLRIGKLAPASKIRATAEFDAAAALIQLQEWDRAAEVLSAFRRTFPTHELQPEATKKIAFVYRSAGKPQLAAAEYERIERESTDEEVRRGALLIAAELYQETAAREKELAVYLRYVALFPKPLEQALELYDRMAQVYRRQGDSTRRSETLKKIVALDEAAGSERTDRTHYLAAQAALVLAEPLFERFAAVELVQPLKQNLAKKKQYMKAAIDGYAKLVDYEVADVTAAATYSMAEIYYHFSRALMKSERPDNLNDLELEQYELALEEQIYPFEEKAIDVHQKNVELLYVGIYSSWIDKSIGKLAHLVPARFARNEATTGFIARIDSYTYVAEPVADAPQPEVPADEAPAAVPPEAVAAAAVNP